MEVDIPNNPQPTASGRSQLHATPRHATPNAQRAALTQRSIGLGDLHTRRLFIQAQWPVQNVVDGIGEAEISVSQNPTEKQRGRADRWRAPHHRAIVRKA